MPTYYVSLAGAGSKDGTSYADRWDGFANIIWGGAGVIAGDTLYICGTVTSETLIVGANGASGNDITIRGDYPGDAGVIDGQDTVSKCITGLSGRTYIIIQNMTLHDAVGYGLHVGDPTGHHLTIDNVTSYGNTHGIIIHGDNCTMTDCITYNNSAHGIRITLSDNTVVQRCTTYSNGTPEQNHDNFFIHGANFLVEDCISYDCTGSGSGFDASSDATNECSGTFRRCITYNNLNMGFSCSGDDKTREIYNYEYCISYGNVNNYGYEIYEDLTVYFYGCVAYGNKCGFDSQGLGDRNVTIKNCILAGNSSRAIGTNPAYVALVAEYNCIDEGIGVVAKVAWVNKNWAEWNTLGYDIVGSNNQDPKFTSVVGGSEDFTLQSDSPCRDTGADLGINYDDGLAPDSSWPDSVTTLDQDDYGVGWEIGAYVYVYGPATWLADQDINITRAKGLNTRLRIVVNATGDTAPADFQLEYKKSTEEDWTKI